MWKHRAKSGVRTDALFSPRTECRGWADPFRRGGGGRRSKAQRARGRHGRPDLAPQSSACKVRVRQGSVEEGLGVQLSSGAITMLFTDIEGSTGLWEKEGERMAAALARHDALALAA